MPRDGHVQVECKVSLMMFNPAKGSSLIGTVKRQNIEGIVVDLRSELLHIKEILFRYCYHSRLIMCF